MKFKQLLTFQDVANELGCDDDTVRALVVEDRSLEAIYVTQIGCKQPYSERQLLRVDAQGRVFDLQGSNGHLGYLRVERSSLDAFKAERSADFEVAASPSAPLHARAEGTYLAIIGALLELVRNPRPGRDSDAAVIRELIENYGERDGISESNLQKRFAEAKRHLRSP